MTHLNGNATATLTLRASAYASPTASPVTITIIAEATVVTNGARVRISHTATFPLTVLALPTGGMIVFSSNHNTLSGPVTNQSSIFIMGLDGSSPTNLTHSSTSDTAPRFSADGHWIVFQHQGANNAAEIWLMRSDGTQAHKVTSSFPGSPPPTVFNLASPSVHHDGSRIVFTALTASGATIAIMDQNGNAQFLTNAPPIVDSPVFSPDDTTIAVSGKLNPQQAHKSLYLLNPADGAVLRTLPNPTTTDFLEPSFSKDGSKLVFTSSTHDPINYNRYFKDIYVMNANDMTGDSIQHLTANHKSEGGAFTGDGWIVFVSGRDQHSEIYVMDATGAYAGGQHARRLTTTSDPNSRNLSPDSQ